MIKTKSAAINGSSTASDLGYCVNDRWIVNTGICSQYQKPNYDKDLSLVCTACVTTGSSTPQIPCYSSSGTCTNNRLSAVQSSDLKT